MSAVTKGRRDSGTAIRSPAERAPHSGMCVRCFLLVEGLSMR